MAAVVRRMLKTWVALGNVSRDFILKINICNPQRLLSPLNVHAVNIHISSHISFHFGVVAAVVRRMLKTWVALGNVSRDFILKINICNPQRLLSPLNVHAVNIHISSLVQQLRLLLVFSFGPLPYLLG